MLIECKAFRKFKRLISFEDEVKALKYKDLPLAVAERRSKIELGAHGCILLEYVAVT